MTAPRSLRQQLKARPDFDTLRSQTPLSITLDPRLNHADRTLFDVVAFLGWPNNACFESTRDLADVAATDQKQVRRSITRLVRCDHAFRRKDGAIVLTSPIFTGKPKVEKPVCTACGASKPLIDGICMACRKQDRAGGEVAAFLKERPDAAAEVVYLVLKARSSKCSAKEIRSAYAKLATDRKCGKIAV